MTAQNGSPGDFIRVITKAPVANIAPVARDVTRAVNENSISSQGDIVAPSDDADGDTLHISSNSNSSLSELLFSIFSLQNLINLLTIGKCLLVQSKNISFSES